MKKQNSYSPILRKCADIADERGQFYGDADENFARIEKILFEMFDLKLTKKEIAMVFVATKFSRQRERHKDDNFLDAINYLAMILHFNKNEKK